MVKTLMHALLLGMNAGVVRRANQQQQPPMQQQPLQQLLACGGGGGAPGGLLRTAAPSGRGASTPAGQFDAMMAAHGHRGMDAALDRSMRGIAETMCARAEVAGPVATSGTIAAPSAIVQSMPALCSGADIDAAVRGVLSFLGSVNRPASLTERQLRARLAMLQRVADSGSKLAALDFERLLTARVLISRGFPVQQLMPLLKPGSNVAPATSMEVYIAHVAALLAGGVDVCGDDTDHQARSWDSGTAAANGRVPYVNETAVLHFEAFDVVVQVGKDGGEATEAALQQHAKSIGVPVKKRVVPVPGAGELELLTIQVAGSKVLLRLRHYQCACAPYALRWLVARSCDVLVAILAAWLDNADAAQLAALPLVESYVRTVYPPQTEKEYKDWGLARSWELAQGQSDSWEDLEASVQGRLRAMGITDKDSLEAWKKARGALTSAAEAHWAATGASFYVPLLSESGVAGGTWHIVVRVCGACWVGAGVRWAMVG